MENTRNPPSGVTPNGQRVYTAADFGAPADESTAPGGSQAEPGMLFFKGKLDTHKHSGKPYDTITWSKIVASAAKPAKVEKNKLRPDDPEPNLPSFIPSTYHQFDGREFARQRAVGDFALATADIDTGNPSLDDVLKASTAIFGVDAELLIYSSSSAKEDERKWRLLVPLAEGVPGEEREVTQRALFDLLFTAGALEEETFDSVAISAFYQLERLHGMYRFDLR